VLAVLDYIAMFDPEAKTISFTRLAYEDNSPGKVFRIPLDVLSALIVEGAINIEGLKVANPGGVQQLVLKETPQVLTSTIATRHYQANQHQTPALNLIGKSARMSLNAGNLFEESA
jgi:hypothetical protein